MAGGNTPKPSSNKPPPSSNSHRKSRWESSAKTSPAESKPSASGDAKSKPSPKPIKNNSKPPTPKPKLEANAKPRPTPKSDPELQTQSALPPFPFLEPPPPPAYGFHMLDRRTIVLADGSVRSYFALPPDYQDFMPLTRPEFRGPGFGFDRPLPMSPEFRPDFRGPDDGFLGPRNVDYRNSMKRKMGEDEREGKDEFERRRLQLLYHGNAGVGESSGAYMGRGEDRPAKYMRSGGGERIKHNDVDQSALKKAFVHFVKLIYENPNQKRKFLADGKQGAVVCLACSRSAKEFPDVHALIMHAYNSDNADMLVDHLGLHKALCILMGWNYGTPPDNSKSYQLLSADEAAVNREDLIMWPPFVIIHNTNTGKGREGRMEGLGNKAMDNYLRDLGFHHGKSKSLYCKDGHLGITLVKFAGDQSGLKEALQLAEYFEKDNHGRKGWTNAQSSTIGKDEENNPKLVKVDERTGEKKRIFYGYLGNVSDIDKVDFDTRKKVMIESRRDFMSSR